MDLKTLNTATKYPSILTYHGLGEKGGLTEERTTFEGVTGRVVHLYEKVDGTNGRIVFIPGHMTGSEDRWDYFIGSRENLLYAKGDRIGDPSQGIVEALKSLADRLSGLIPRRNGIGVIYLEVYGGKIGAHAKQYTGNGEVGFRMFDQQYLDPEVLTWDREDISTWRESNQQEWMNVLDLQGFSSHYDIPLVPPLGVVDAGVLPTTVEGMNQWLVDALPATHAALDQTGGGKAEGIVLRTADRSVIAKARFQDYERTLKRRK